MIEVVAKLLRGPVYLSGEIIECSIVFTRPKLPENRMAQSHTDAYCSLAWASAQIHCQCTLDNKVVKADGTKNPLTVPNSTSLTVSSGEDAGQVEFATKPKILFCDLQLAPGQSKAFIYREKVPTDTPPSYRGQLVKYAYKITIGTQRINCPVKMLRVPLRILPLDIAALGDLGVLCNETTEELTPANPFLEVRQHHDKETPIDLALQALQNITARRVPNFYMITNIWGKVARFCLFKPSYKLGEDIIGTFDFTVATVHCMQVSVSLQCEEEIRSSDGTKHTRFVTFSKHHEVCLGLKYTQLILPIPLHVTPAFTTQLVDLKWRLHFEFVTSTCKDLDVPEESVGEWRAPTDVPIETMVWSLPIRLYSTMPSHVTQGLQTNTTYSLAIK